jgi:hypothetical protein
MFVALEVSGRTFSFKENIRKFGRLSIFWLLIVAVLIALRLARASIPVINWDSLNHHLPLLMERLNVASWGPLWDVPTDRRTPLLGVILKLPIFAVDVYGRSLGLYHNLLGLLVSWRLLKVIKHRFEMSDQHCFWLGVLWLSLTDIWWYMGLMGDEPWLLLISAVWIEHLLRAQYTNRSWALLVALMGLGLCIKMTALFFLCPVFLMGLWEGRRHKKGLLWGLLCALLINMSVHAFTWLPYGMVYPVQRWSDLLAQASPAKVFDGAEIKSRRAAMGLPDHQDNHGAASSALAMLNSNLYRSGKWGTGVLLYWSMMLGAWIMFIKRYKQDPFWFRLWAQLTLGLLITMCLWSFSPQAMTRYNMPLWLWAWVLCANLMSLKSVIVSWAFKGICSCTLCLSLALEAKALVLKMGQAHLLAPMDYWEKHLVDGGLVSVFESVAGPGERAFYAGSSSLLWAGKGHVLAQVGNEVGWRDIDRMPHFLHSKGIRWLVISNVARSYDPVIAQLLDQLRREGCIEKEHQLKGGAIYRVYDSPVLDSRQPTV